MSTSSPTTESGFRALQFRLTTLLVFTAWLAILCAGFTAPLPPWPTIISATTLLSIFSSGLLAAYRTTRTRAAAMGYLIFSSGYLVYLHFRPMPYWPGVMGVGETDTGYLPTRLYHLLHGDVGYLATGFFEIYHQALATLLGLLGSLLAQYLYATQPREKPPTTNPQP